MTDKNRGRVLILGAGLMQRPAILAARSLGMSVYVVDADEKAICIQLADSFAPIDLKDRDAVAANALELKQEKAGLAAVFTAGTDFSASVSYAAAKCGLPAHSFEAALNASDKLRMRACFDKMGVPSPRFFEVDKNNITQFLDCAGSDIFPLVVKPADNMGARGCRMVRNADEYGHALQEAIAYSRTGRAIVEEYMEGSEFSVDALVYEGTLTICGFADRHICYPPYFIEMGHTIPSALNEERQFAVLSAFARGVQALGLTCGAAKGDIKLTERGPMIGEIAARLSGGYMSGWTFPYASGFAVTEEALKIACGIQPDVLLSERQNISSVQADGIPFGLYEIPCNAVCAERAWISIPGTVGSIYGLPEAENERANGLKDILPRIGEGSCVNFPRNNVEKCGNIISAACGRTAATCAERAVSEIVVRLLPDNAATEAFLSGAVCGGEDGFPPDAYTDADGKSIELAEADTVPIPVAGSIMDSVPQCLLPYLNTLHDWNHRSLRDTIVLFERLCPQRPVLNALELWRSCLRGGIQGMLYVADSALRESR